MAQVTLYLPDDVAKSVREAARKSKKSISAFMTELAVSRLQPGRWPSDFAGLFGSWKGEIPIPEDPPPADGETLD